MKPFLIVFLMGMASFSVLAENDKSIASDELIAELKEYCEEIAEDEGTGSKSLPEFLLECINEELESEDLQPITKLPL